MSFLLPCPNCGPRDVAEFRYGGQIVGNSAGALVPSNLPEPQLERWFHRFGCRRWLVAERDVRNNDVLATRWLEEQDIARAEPISGDAGEAAEKV